MTAPHVCMHDDVHKNYLDMHNLCALMCCIHGSSEMHMHRGSMKHIIYSVLHEVCSSPLQAS